MNNDRLAEIRSDADCGLTLSPDEARELLDEIKRLQARVADLEVALPAEGDVVIPAVIAKKHRQRQCEKRK